MIIGNTPTKREIDRKECAKMHVGRMKVTPDTVVYADWEQHKLIVEFTIPGAPTEAIEKMHTPYQKLIHMIELRETKEA